MSTTHQTAKTLYVDSHNLTYAYRRLGKAGGVPLLCLIHFRGTMDYWDPLLINTLARSRQVILFDNAGVGQSTGEVADTIKGMAKHAINLLEVLQIKEADVLGFSMGGYVAPLVYLNAPKGTIRKLIIAGSGPGFGEELAEPAAGRAEKVGQWAGQALPDFDNCFSGLFFYPSETSQAAGKAWWERVHERSESTSGEARSALVSAGYKDGGKGIRAMLQAGNAFMDPSQRADGSYDRLAEITCPVFIAQGHDDFMIPTQRSFIMQQKLPDARLKIFPDSGHGFLYQYAEEFADDVVEFLGMDES